MLLGIRLILVRFVVIKNLVHDYEIKVQVLLKLVMEMVNGVLFIVIEEEQIDVVDYEIVSFQIDNVKVHL